jgi:hypothetical protein
MELAVHLKNTKGMHTLNGLPEHLSMLYEGKALKGLDGFVRDDQRSLRLYIGDEFCSHRLPGPAEFDTLCQLAKVESRALTFLTPPLTDAGIAKCGPLFDILNEMNDGTEVVVNDWGVLLFLKEKYPSFQLSVGRLLNKGFKDPRLMNPDEALTLSDEKAELLNACTFDAVDFPAKMRQLNVKRLERDLLPFGDSIIKRLGGLQASVYFPFGYITTGRVCWMSSFHTDAGRKFSISNGCHRTCQKINLKLNHAKTNLQLFQMGNTIFYLYPPSKLDALVKHAKTHKLRLVYQGLMV